MTALGSRETKDAGLDFARPRGEKSPHHQARKTRRSPFVYIKKNKKGNTFEVDEFFGQNEGLTIAEV